MWKCSTILESQLTRFCIENSPQGSGWISSHASCSVHSRCTSAISRSQRKVDGKRRSLDGKWKDMRNVNNAWGFGKVTTRFDRRHNVRVIRAAKPICRRKTERGKISNPEYSIFRDQPTPRASPLRINTLLCRDLLPCVFRLRFQNQMGSFDLVDNCSRI